jgi:FG-GAP repeat/RTX calcium-binding nonapeptide repeat (4 copies)
MVMAHSEIQRSGNFNQNTQKENAIVTGTLNLSDLINGSNGFVLNGIDASDYSGRTVSSAGDVNGDGFDDLIIGASGADPNGNSRAGESYVVFGKSEGFGTGLNLSSLNGSNGFVLNGINTDDYSGFSVSGAGDVNGDGFDDLIIGANRADPNGINDAGESYVVFGKSGGFDPSVNLLTLDGSNGFAISGIDASDLLGDSVSNAGDVNGDGFDDIIIGARYASPNGNSSAGESYVVFGKNGGFDPSLNLNLSSLDGNNGFVLNGIDANDLSGASVSSAGDVNGFDDLIIGAVLADPNGNSYAGESYVVFGKSGGFAASLDLSTLDGSNGFVLNGIDAYDVSGASVSGAGDVNGDGFDDLIIGADLADPNGINDAGESYVVFGKSGGFAPSLNLSSLDGSNGFVINGIDAIDESGVSVSGAGDVNGDGFDDLIIGAELADPNGRDRSGESYLVFGKSGGFAASLNLSSLDGSNGFIFNGIDVNDRSGVSVSSAGDVNNDGFDDLIIGAERGDPNGNSSAGESYVIFGSEFFVTPVNDDRTLNANNNTLDALAGNDTIRAGNGDDDVFGNDGTDRLLGQNGADTLDGGADNDILNGGNQDDVLLGSSGNDALNGDSQNDRLFGGTGNDRLNGGLNNDTLIGVDESSPSPGLGEKDALTGNSGADLFVLGNTATVFYDDNGITVADGNVSRAVVQDLDVGIDRIQLHGSAADYVLQVTASGNTNIFYRPVGEVRDLIGIVSGTIGLDLANTSTFVFVE